MTNQEIQVIKSKKFEQLPTSHKIKYVEESYEKISGALNSIEHPIKLQGTALKTVASEEKFLGLTAITTATATVATAVLGFGVLELNQAANLSIIVLTSLGIISSVCVSTDFAFKDASAFPRLLTRIFRKKKVCTLEQKYSIDFSHKSEIFKDSHRKLDPLMDKINQYAQSIIEDYDRSHKLNTLNFNGKFSINIDQNKVSKEISSTIDNHRMIEQAKSETTRN